MADGAIIFVHPVMLAGIGGAVLPLVLHLLNRARYRNIRWGAMMFLRDPGNSAADLPARLHSAAVLFLRMVIVALIAIALARPMIHGKSDSRICVVLLFDNSAGMAFDEGTPGPRLETARDSALAILNHLQRDDEVHVLTLSGPQAEASDAWDLQSAVSQIADIHTSTSPADISTGLTAAAKVIAHSDITRKVILLVADREATAWRGISDQFAATYRQQMLSYGADLRMIFVPIGSESCENIAIDRISLPPPPLVRGTSMNAQVIVHNYGALPVRGVPIEMRVVGQRSGDRRTIDLPAAGTEAVQFPLTFNANGYYQILAQIGDDSNVPGKVTFDDQALAVADIVDPLTVHIIEDRYPTTTQSTSAPLAPSDILAAALAPFGQGGVGGAAPTIERWSWPSAGSSPWADQLATADVAVLCGTPAPDATQIEKLKAFVLRGGGLLLLPGNDGADCINALFDPAIGLAPVNLRAPAATTRPVGVVLTNVARRQQLIVGHNGADLFAGVTLDRIAGVNRHSSDAEQLAQTLDARPWLVAKSFGRGRVIAATTGLGEPWGNLADRPAIVTLAQGVIHWLAAGGADRLNLSLDEPLELHALPTGVTHITVVSPDGSRQDSPGLRSNDQATVSFPNTSIPGRYELQMKSPAGDLSIPFVVRPSREGSDLTPISAQRLNRLEQILNLRQLSVQSTDDVTSAFGRVLPYELWKPLLLAVILSILAELWLSNRFSGGHQ